MGDTRFTEPFERLQRTPAIVRDPGTFSDDDLVSALAGNSNDPYTANVAASELMNRLRRKNAVLEVAAEGLCSLDPLGQIVFMNHAAENRLGIDSGAGVSKNFHDTIHRHAEDEGARNADCPLLLAMRMRSRVFVDDDWFVRGDGSSFHVSYSVNPIMRGGDLDGFVLAFRDTTETRRRMDSLELRETRIVAAQKLAGIGRWDWDLVHNSLTWAQETFDALGVHPGEFGGTFEAFLALVPDREREHVKSELREAMKYQSRVAIVHHIESPDFGERRVETRGEFVYALDGTPIAAWGTHQDLSPSLTMSSHQGRAMKRRRR